MSAIVETDIRSKFIFDNLPIRGVLVTLETAWKDILAPHDYSPLLKEILGQTVAGMVALSSSMKYDGLLQFRMFGKGYIQQLSATATTSNGCRGVALANEDIKPASHSIMDLTDPDTVVQIALEQKGLNPYQGIIKADKEKIEGLLMDYFEYSEQIPTELRLAADGKTIAALLIQKMPGENLTKGSSDEFETIRMLARSITDKELLELESSEILHRLFHQYDVRILEQNPIHFECSCSTEKFMDAIRSVGEDEAREILKENGKIEVECGNCLTKYQFGPNEVDEIFKGGE